MASVKRLDAQQLEEVLAGASVIIFKHSTRCPISSSALREVERFKEENPEAPVYRLDVIEDRGLSNQVAEQWGVQHESPQVLIVKGKELLWSGSHFEINLQKRVAQSLVLRSTTVSE